MDEFAAVRQDLAAKLTPPVLKAHSDALRVLASLNALLNLCESWYDDFALYHPVVLVNTAREYVMLRDACLSASESVVGVPFDADYDGRMVSLGSGEIVGEPFHPAVVHLGQATLADFDISLWDENYPPLPKDGSEDAILAWLSESQDRVPENCGITYRDVQVLIISLEGEAIRASKPLNNTQHELSLNAGNVTTDVPRDRMEFNAKDCRVRVDDTWHAVNASAYMLLRACWDSYPHAISAKELAGDIRPRDVKKQLPRQLNAVFRSIPGKGCWLRLRDSDPDE
jgi:hypothetical protein